MAAKPDNNAVLNRAAKVIAPIGTDGAPTTLSGTPVISVYKNSSLVQSAVGITLTVDFDSITGLNNVLIDLSADAFYDIANDYQVVITTGTVGGTSVVGYVVGQFSIENRFVEVDVTQWLGVAPLALVSQRVNVSVGAMAANVITAAAINAAAITAAKFGAGAIDAAAIATDAITNAKIAADAIGTSEFAQALIDAIADANWDEAKAGHVAAGSFGEEVQAHALSSEVTALNDLSAAEVNAEMVDVIDTDVSGEPAQGAPPASASLRTKIDHLFKNWRNKKDEDSTLFQLYNDAGTVVDAKATVSDAAGLTTKEEIVSGP